MMAKGATKMARTYTRDMTQGSPTKLIFGFFFPLLFGILFQQVYNMVDTMVVGRFLGSVALAAVGSAFSLMTLMTSLLLGLAALALTGLVLWVVWSSLDTLWSAARGLLP